LHDREHPVEASCCEIDRRDDEVQRAPIADGQADGRFLVDLGEQGPADPGELGVGERRPVRRR